MSTLSRILATALVAAVLLPPPAVLAASASSRAAADAAEVQRLTREAHVLYKEGKFLDAAQTLLKAYELKPVPELLFNVARSYDEGGNSEEALRWYQRYLDTEGAKPDLLARAARSLERLRADVEKKREEARQIELENERNKREAAEAEAARKREAPPAAVAKESPARGSSPWPWVAGGVGAAGLLAGVGFGLAASSAADQLGASDQLATKQALADSAGTRALLADVGYGVAVVGTGLAIWLFLADGEAPATTPSAPPASDAVSAL